MRWTALFPESVKTTSIGNLMKNVCTELHGFKMNALQGGNDLLPIRPKNLEKNVSAIVQFSRICIMKPL